MSKYEEKISHRILLNETFQLERRKTEFGRAAVNNIVEQSRFYGKLNIHENLKYNSILRSEIEASYIFL